MLNAAWLIVHLIANSVPSMPAVAAQAGVSCTYQACMAKCGRLNGTICNSYCDAKIRQRVAGGVCKAPDDLAGLQDQRY
ncbi:hypothetical protein [Afipia clevelandensis]|uniref:Uncharacterized protein n=1 Tax=Afipia clevelandensis ATCC 49720 TaxID=883079 RepID=K8PMI0_9BRAD|nr:hypothetical protein [Afipia clevelandensis]EKS42791.1 hypothetical protein HMPREF9696_00334 [Afipia clevelandensis ATCC 49720]